MTSQFHEGGTINIYSFVSPNNKICYRWESYPIDSLSDLEPLHHEHNNTLLMFWTNLKEMSNWVVRTGIDIGVKILWLTMCSLRISTPVCTLCCSSHVVCSQLSCACMFSNVLCCALRKFNYDKLNHYLRVEKVPSTLGQYKTE